MWGPEPFTAVGPEKYVDAPGGTVPGETLGNATYAAGDRPVQYFDKARMEITAPNGDTSSPWYVTNGLLVVELITGRMQIGDTSFENRESAVVNVAGDSDDPTGPTYATFSNVLDAPALPVGTTITQRIDRAATVTSDPSLAGYGVTAAFLDDVTQHAVASPFWEFMNSAGVIYENGQYVDGPLFPNPFYATGRPITEAYWANVKVAGKYQDVLMQCFERRCLTYTPGNNPGWQVEAGNVGRHYFQWRHGQSGPPPTPPSRPEPTPTDGRSIWAYDNPEAAILMAISEILGHDASPERHRFLLSHAGIIRNLYHIATADVGSFNADIHSFYPWLKSHLDQTYFNRLNSYRSELAIHAETQVKACIYQPNTPIGVLFRQLEVKFWAEDPNLVLNLYWYGLIRPAAIGAYPLGINPLVLPIAFDDFQELFRSYVTSTMFGNQSATTFGTYLAQQQYVPVAFSD